jgi:poly [ADP-ribose] polymerase
MKTVYLVKVEADANNNKYYKMIELGSTFEVQYGRIGNTSYQSKTYPMGKWHSTLNSKIKKGYVDQTRLIEVPIIKKKNEYLSLDNPNISKIVERLQAIARQTVKDNYTISSDKVTQLMVDEAQTLLYNLGNENECNKFNEVLLQLFKTIPRKMKKVVDYLAESKDDYISIINREQDLLDIMEGQVKQNKIEDNNNNDDDVVTKNQTILEALGIEFEELNDKDIKAIKSKMGSMQDKFKQGWKITNKKTQNKYNDYLKSENILKTDLFFHGTRSENVWSILNSGLVLRPNAVITGKMFGSGIYLSNDFDKSRGYTSVSGSRWSHGSEHTGFMLLMETAYGKAYDVYSFDSKYYNFNQNILQSACKGANCLHAHGGTGMLRKDEIVVYKEEACTVKYLIEII